MADIRFVTDGWTDGHAILICHPKFLRGHKKSERSVCLLVSPFFMMYWYMKFQNTKLCGPYQTLQMTWWTLKVQVFSPVVPQWSFKVMRQTMWWLVHVYYYWYFISSLYECKIWPMFNPYLGEASLRMATQLMHIVNCLEIVLELSQLEFGDSQLTSWESFNKRRKPILYKTSKSWARTN